VFTDRIVHFIFSNPAAMGRTLQPAASYAKLQCQHCAMKTLWRAGASPQALGQAWHHVVALGVSRDPRVRALALDQQRRLAEAKQESEMIMS